MKRKNDVAYAEDIISMPITDDEKEAIKDAMNFLENVADDRGQSSINYERQEEVIKIIDDFLVRLDT